ncbi:MAG: hypothetical protein IAE79_12180 [Anaerolinea sp.]|nr:hypothetical protein [Anaerolinea sp.]
MNHDESLFSWIGFLAPGTLSKKKTCHKHVISYQIGHLSVRRPCHFMPIRAARQQVILAKGAPVSTSSTGKVSGYAAFLAAGLIVLFFVDEKKARLASGQLNPG